MEPDSDIPASSDSAKLTDVGDGREFEAISKHQEKPETIGAGDTMNGRSWFNVLCKAIGAYWISSGVMYGIQVAYQLVSTNVVETEYVAEPQLDTYRLLMSFTSLVVGATMLFASKSITNLAFVLDDSKGA